MGEREEYEAEVLAEVASEQMEDEPVLRELRYREFVSKSYGRRNGKRRPRRNWKEIYLLRYPGAGNDTRWYTWERFPWENCAQEILGDGYQCEDPVRVLQERIMELTQVYGQRW